MRLLALFVSLFLAAAISTDRVAAETSVYGGLNTHCLADGNTDLNSTMATCSDTGGNSNFKSVLIVIHGWGGDCRSTFGEGTETLHAYLLQDSHYDIDCLNYDSQGLSVEDAAIQLRRRLNYLRDRGYSDFGFVTHSLGGIVFLQMLVDSALTDDGTQLRKDGDTERVFKAGGPHLRFASIWASPIDGVRWEIAASAAWADIFGALPANTVAAITHDGPYLVHLKTRLIAMDRLLVAADGEMQAAYQSKLTFFQGGTADGVVRDIDEADDWYQSLKTFVGFTVDLVLTGEGHSNTVGDSVHGTRPRFPSKIIALENRLDLPIAIRLDDVFPLTGQQVVGRQLKVINGSTGFIRQANLFEPAKREISKLFARIIRRGRVHVTEVDEAMTTKLLEIVRLRATLLQHDPQKEAFMDLVDIFACADEIKSFDVSSTTTADLGSGGSAAGDALLQFLQDLVDTARDLVKTDPTLNDLFKDCNDFNDADTRIAQLMLRSKESNHGSHRQVALSSLKNFAQSADADVVLASGTMEQLAQYAGAKGLTEDMSKTIGETLLAASTRSEPLRQQMAAAFAKKTSEGRPLFTKVLDDIQLERLIAATGSDAIQPADRQLLQEAMTSLGTRGNNTQLSTQAFEILAGSVRKIDDPALRLQRIDDINTAVIAPQYPGLARRFDQTLQQLR